MDRFVHWNAIEIRRPNIQVWVSKYLFVYWFIFLIRYIIKLILYNLHTCNMLYEEVLDKAEPVILPENNKKGHFKYFTQL